MSFGVGLNPFYIMEGILMEGGMYVQYGVVAWGGLNPFYIMEGILIWISRNAVKTAMPVLIHSTSWKEF